MQTFLPYASFELSARCLDDARLRKQLVEAVQIHNTISGKSEGWKKHPAVRQWVGHADALTEYAWYIGMECLARGFQCSPFPFKVVTNGIKPKWFGREDFHTSHRSRLLFKGRVDAVSYSLRTHLKVRSINEWFSNNNYPQKNVFKHPDIERLEKYCLDLAVKIRDNHYRQFWNDDDNIPYVWPV